MSSILMKLQYLEFPDCTREALSYLVHTFSSSHGGIPGLGGGNENFAGEVAQEYILNVARRRGHNAMRLNAMLELQLLDMVCSTLQDAPEQSCYSIFSAIFGGHVDTHKAAMLTKLVSMAVSISCGAVLGCAAIWMQEQGSQSQVVCDLSQKLVDDYCLLYPNISKTFQNLPKASSLFTCNFVTALTTIYTYTDPSKSPPLGLLECIVDWISDDPCLCSDSVRLSRIRSNFTCPVSGLVRWCVLGPVVTACTKDTPSSSSNALATQSSNSLKMTDRANLKSQETMSKLSPLFSRLHLGVLQSLQAYKTMELNQELFMFGDIYIPAKLLSGYYQGGHCSEDVQQTINTSVDRLGQTIQVGIATGSLVGKLDIRQISDILPPNRLMRMIASMKTSRQPDVMDIS